MKDDTVLEEIEKIRQDDLFKLICQKVDSFRKIDWDKISTPSRRRVHVEPRQLIFYFMKTHSSYTISLIGGVFNRDHATVIHAEKTVLYLHETNKSWKEFISQANLEISKFIFQNRKKNEVTRYGLFKEILENFVQDEKIQKEWMQTYLNAKL